MTEILMSYQELVNQGNHSNGSLETIDNRFATTDTHLENEEKELIQVKEYGFQPYKLPKNCFSPVVRSIIGWRTLPKMQNGLRK
ncbi:MAG: hypothetical protein M3142_16340 [Bacteroidota bacterium]|nr:hypothetical protein [Bacteroidota bacterium]